MLFVGSKGPHEGKKLKSFDSKKLERKNKPFDCVVKSNRKSYEGKKDPIVLEEWIRQMKKIFDVVEVPDIKCVTSEAFYFIGQADI